MKHEYVHRYRLSNNLIEDLDTTKLFCDNLCLPNQGSIEGYIRSIRYNPFGFVLISDIQVIFNVFPLICLIAYFISSCSSCKCG
jgi:hypothetical protein